MYFSYSIIKKLKIPIHSYFCCMSTLVIIGGGAAGFFAAINAKEVNPELDVIILEKSNKLLSKVKVSGGGRCNVTHACFEPRELIKFYPRGSKELMGPFHQFMTGDTFEWFAERGVELKIEEDNRVFPKSNDSQTIIDCFLDLARKYKVDIRKQQTVIDFDITEDTIIIDLGDEQLKADKLIIATGSSKQMWDKLTDKDVTIVDPVPSLFTFNIKHPLLLGSEGIVAPNAKVKVLQTKHEQSGPLLITHWGVSGPAVLKLSAVGARDLFQLNYQFSIKVDWDQNLDREDLLNEMIQLRENHSKQLAGNVKMSINLPKRIKHKMLEQSGIQLKEPMQIISNKQLNKFVEMVKNTQFTVNGKSTNKEEFVTAGGVDLREINFKNFSLKKYPNVHVIGECLNIDALTGGFNFQAAWTGGFVVAQSL